MGAGVMNPGLRTAVEMDWRLQTNKPDPLIRVGQEISTSAGAKPGSDVSRAGAKNAQAAVVPTPHSGLPLVPSAVAAGTCQAEPRRHSWPEAVR